MCPLSVVSRNNPCYLLKLFLFHFAEAETIREVPMLGSIRPNLLIWSPVLLSFYLAPSHCQDLPGEQMTQGWLPLGTGVASHQEIWIHGWLDVFWVPFLTKVYPGQGVLLFIRCQRVEFLCKLSTGLAGQEKANKNCMRFGVGWGWMAAVSPLTQPLLHERESWTSARLMCFLEELIWHRSKRWYEGKFMRLERPEKLTVHFVFFKDAHVGK